MRADIVAWSPKTLDDALSLLADNEKVTVLAGGTDLLVYMQAHLMSPTHVLNIWGLDELRGIAVRGDELLIGALESFTHIAESALVQTHAPKLVHAAKTVGAAQIQNRATLGGNFANASPAADSPPVLLCANATLELTSPRGQRDVPATEFFKGYKQLDLAKDELITRFRIPIKRPEHRDFFVKVGTRRAQSISKVVMAGRASLGAHGRIESAAIAVGSVAATTVRLPLTEALLVDQAPDAALQTAARQMAMSEVKPLDDVRSTETYRLTVTGNLAAWFVRYIAEA